MNILYQCEHCKEKAEFISIKDCENHESVCACKHEKTRIHAEHIISPDGLPESYIELVRECELCGHHGDSDIACIDDEDFDRLFKWAKKPKINPKTKRKAK
jgi:hypothetical protein